MGLLSGIAAIANVVRGAVADKKNRKHAEGLKFDASPQGIRKNATEAGFNPLSFIAGGGGGGYAPSLTNHLGSSLADLSGTLNDIEALQIQRGELELQRDRLEKLNKDTTLKAPDGGVYQRGATNRPKGPVGDVSDGLFDATDSRRDTLRNSRNSGDGSPRTYDDDVKAPAFTLGGIDFHGSGAISSGEGFEDALGEGPLTWPVQPFVAADAFGHTIGNYQSQKEQKEADRLMDEWFRRSATGETKADTARREKAMRARAAYEREQERKRNKISPLLWE